MTPTHKHPAARVFASASHAGARVWARLLSLVLSAFWGSGGSSPVAPSISDFATVAEARAVSTRAPGGSPGWHRLATGRRGLHLAQGCMGDPALHSRSPSAYPKAGGRGWPADTALCCPISSRSLGSQQSRWGRRCPLTLGSPEQEANDFADPSRVPLDCLPRSSESAIWGVLPPRQGQG